MSSFLLEQYEDIARHFFLKFFDIELENIEIDDETNIFDILNLSEDLLKRNEQIQKLKDDIEKEYKVDISDLEDLKLSEIFQRIELLR